MVGAAFTALVQAVVEGLITPLIAAATGTPDFSKLHFTFNHSVFDYGDVVSALISFVIAAAVLYFLVVMPFSTLTGRVRGPIPTTSKQCPECLSSIPLAARRCAYCTGPQPAAA